MAERDQTHEGRAATAQPLRFIDDPHGLLATLKSQAAHHRAAAKDAATEAAPPEPAGPRPLDAQAVASLHRRFEEKIDRLVAKALPADAEPSRRGAMRAYVRAALAARKPPDKGELAEMAEMAELSEHDIFRRAQRKYRDPGQMMVAHAPLREAAEARRAAPLYSDELFGDRDRIYLPLTGSGEKSETQEKVETLLAEKGYTDIDYAGGYAWQGKNKLKIGKILQREDPKLGDAFSHDGSRSADKMLVVLSRDPEDVARMSTGRSWRSCMAENGMFFNHVPREITQGTLVAYLVRESDPEINDPLCRVLFKPYEDRDGRRILKPGRIYGLQDYPGLRDTAEAYVEARFNAGKHGRFKLAQGIYLDSMPREMINLPKDLSAYPVEDLLRDFQIPYKAQDRDGQRILRIRNLDLNNQGITALPPGLAEVEVTENVNLAGNELTSLAGCPRRIGGDINIRNNPLVDLTGGPERVGGSFKANDIGLESLAGGPRHVGRNFHANNNKLTSLAGAPREVGGDFLVSDNRLRDLSGAPEKVRLDFDASRNELTRLDGMTPDIGFALKLAGNRLTDLTGTPRQVDGSFDVSGNRLTSLEGGPRGVGGDYKAQNNQLANLAGAPASIARDFDVSDNVLTRLEGGPRQIGGSFTAKNNHLTSLEGGPIRVFKHYRVANNNLTGLEGAPTRMGGNFNCCHNQITSLAGAPQKVGGSFLAHHNRLTSLAGGPVKVKGLNYSVSDNPLVSLEGVPRKLGVLKIRRTRLTSLEGGPEHMIGLRATGTPLRNLAGLPRKLNSNKYDKLMAALHHPETGIKSDLGNFKGASRVPEALRDPNHDALADKQAQAEPGARTGAEAGATAAAAPDLDEDGDDTPAPARKPAAPRPF